MSRAGAERVYALLVHALLPRAFRAEFGAQMVRAFGDWRSAHASRSAWAGARLWAAALGDLVRSGAREWSAVVRAGRGEARPPYGAAVLAGGAVLLLYAVTLAPTIGFWDAGEYVTVAHTLSIPHPPGNPLFVLLAHAWEGVLSPLGLPTAVSINLFSAVCSALAHALWFLVIDRALAGWSGDRVVRRIGAGVAVLLSATAFTVWSQSNVNEKVYTISLLTTALIVWLALRWRDGRRGVAPLALIAFLLALTATNHLMGVLAAPAVLAIVLMTDARVLLRARLWATAVPLAALALSVQLFLPLRAAQRPIIAEGDPQCETVTAAAVSIYTWGRGGCEALSAVLRRDQYGKPPITVDPTDPGMPRGGALLGAQIVNWLQYLDWQWARSVAGMDPLFGGARPLITLVFLLLAGMGARSHWRSDRTSAAALGTLLVTLTLGLVVYLNFKYGYTIATDRLPQAAMHEVRERDYFFLVGFSVLGLWVGLGVAETWRRMAEGLQSRTLHPRLAAAPVLCVGLLPLALNWGWASRAEDYTPRDWAYNVLMSVEPYGVLVTNGDNDSFPLWYLQEVEGLRRDVTVVLSPLLGSPWYVRQLRDLTEPCKAGQSAADAPTRIVCQRAFDAAELPAPLVKAGWTQTARPPVDSIVPLSDEEIASLAGGWSIAEEPLPFRAGEIETEIAPGTLIDPAALYLAAILQATLGERAIHFMPSAPLVRTLGLSEHVVRQGVVWRLANAASPDWSDTVVALPLEGDTPIDAAGIDLALTDTLLGDVYLRRGRLLDPAAPWQDHSVVSIPMQYAFAHYAMAQGYADSGRSEEAGRHIAHGDWWQAAALNRPRPPVPTE